MHVIETEQLKCCPFCGGRAKLKTDKFAMNEAYNYYRIFCTECGTSGRMFLDGQTIGFENCPSRNVPLEEAAGKAAEAWNRRTGPDITELQDDIYELSIVAEKVEAIADELQQEYFGEAEPESSMLNANYDRGRILSNIVFDYAHRTKEITEALEGKV